MLTIKTVEAIPPGRTAWDEGRGAVAGLGARRQTGDAVAYVVKYRTAGRSPALAYDRPPWLALDAGPRPRRSAAHPRRSDEGARPGGREARGQEGRDTRRAVRPIPCGRSRWPAHHSARGLKEAEHARGRSRQDRAPHQAGPRHSEGGAASGARISSACATPSARARRRPG